MSIIDSAKEASRQRLRPILMTSFAFVMGVLPMARATGAGAYSRNSLGIVIAFGMAISTVLGRFVIPIYYVLGERLIQAFGGGIEASAGEEQATRRRLSSIATQNDPRRHWSMASECSGNQIPATAVLPRRTAHDRLGWR